MKRVGNLWDGLTSFPNLVDAARKASCGKRSKPNVSRFRFNLEHELVELQDALRHDSYRPSPYRTFEIFEPKRRLISAAPFPDRVVHHALCNVLEPIFERTFVHDSYACRKRKGTHAAVRRCRHFARRSKYTLKCDIRKFFPSVDHAVLKQIIARKIKDRQVLNLIGRIVDGSNPQEPVLRWFPGDDLFSPVNRRHGIPIGNQTSQFFANVLLNVLDHFADEVLCPAGYLRYVDDFVLFGDQRAMLHDARTRIREFLGDMRLQLHPGKSVISRTMDGIRFLGYRVFPNRILLPRDNLVRWRRKLKILQRLYASGELDAGEIGQRIAAWHGHAHHARGAALQSDILNSTLFRRTREDSRE